MSKVALYLFHGRKDPAQPMDDWGEPGPYLGPFDFVHCTYGADLKFAVDGEDQMTDLTILGDVVFYDGMYYGDWSVIPVESIPEGELQMIDTAKATPPQPQTIAQYRLDLSWDDLSHRTMQDVCVKVPLNIPKEMSEDQSRRLYELYPAQYKIELLLTPKEETGADI